MVQFLMGATTKQAFAVIGDFSKCPSITQEQLDAMYCGMGVTIDEEKFNRPDHWPKDELLLE